VDDVLAVVQYQQGGTRTERVDDAGQDVRRDAEVTDRGAPGLPDAEGRRDLADDVVSGGDTDQGHEMHDALLGLAAHDLRETGLAKATGPDDRGDAGGSQQVRHRGEVIGAAEQRVGLVRDPVPDRWRLTLQQLPVQGLERRAGVAAKLVAQRAAVGVVPGQRRGRSSRRRLAAQQLQQDLLVPGPLCDQLGQRLGRLGASAQPRQRQRAGTRQRPLRRCPFGAQRRHRVVVPGVAALSRFVQRETRLGVRERRLMVAGAGVPCARGCTEQDRGGVGLVLAQGKPVAGGGAGDDVGAQLPSGAGDGDLLIAVGHPRQQGQLDGHQSRVRRRRYPPHVARDPDHTGSWRVVGSRGRPAASVPPGRGAARPPGSLRRRRGRR